MAGSQLRTKDKLNRLRRIEGQVRGLQQMVADDRYCIDILTQLQAVKAALARVELMVLEDHIRSCIRASLASPDEADREAKIAELVTLLTRALR